MRGTDALRRSDAVARSYRAALARLVRGEGRHADHAGRVVRISPASVAREAGRSRNPLYTTHRDILDEIDDVLESNAEDFVKSFIQKGGQ